MDNQHEPPPRDRREALKSRHRRAIVDAATALMTERGDTGFTVDQLSERADVSRRTVFNHFRSLDDIVLEVFGEMLEAFVDSIEANLPAVTGDRAGNMFDELAAAIRRTDLVTPITRLKRLLRQQGNEPAPSQSALFERAINDLSVRLAAIMTRRHPHADPLVVDLMCGAVISGGAITVQRWERTTGGVDNDDSRRVWADLLDRMLAVTRDGYGNAGSPTS
ncbi:MULTISPECIES: TetR/AcrR family transcriptional regulator [Nocardiopsis]|uniref:Transcriptional regulator, TetR family n=1 Tax=Nocardiopsis dassonvillei (strain ATCC 23218 / DSM 43111 / CIP 107115 / JCM 7437 / KCTC 9190 / NBRC 14626 / NCTC 10488 / NRRL B-5397 / IMRU 509) TaxID=446468 RepID=D7B1H1_NOCDD|nr:TetR/AcrR family transcriptional regulator [Nocardiopsis dassonvillei]ADH66562.1 transcriptional regulator, TetR family [Nocardiopsis dassonvillei subsp. dassonvillei DSM 43111]APC34879.1 TetR family transcriptional regulator [Nocardiopsis dassonvillei]NKY80971.1 TetR/AcrR family transcriptional regulator [Nocardiopsis dassonvillei]VEI92584.1 mycofactocin system transcriptional regulator [Nocardiopsis dassonvillei]